VNFLEIKLTQPIEKIFSRFAEEKNSALLFSAEIFPILRGNRFSRQGRFLFSHPAKKYHALSP